MADHTDNGVVRGEFPCSLLTNALLAAPIFEDSLQLESLYAASFFDRGQLRQRTDDAVVWQEVE